VLQQFKGKRRWDFKITDWNRPGAMAGRPDFEQYIADDCTP
jgi:hypothetical protein